MIKLKLFIATVVVLLALSSCETAKKAYLGIGKTEVKVRPENDVIKYYEPFLIGNTYKTKLYVISNFDAADKALKDFGFPRIFIKNRQTNIVYELNCFEDLEANIDDVNNNIFSEYITLKNPTDFTNLTAFTGDKAESKLLVYSGESDTNKTWDIYISYATFLGKKLRKLTLPVTKLKDINEVVILDLSIDENAIKIEQ